MRSFLAENQSRYDTWKEGGIGRSIIVRPDIMQDKMPSETMTRFQTALLRFCSASLPNSVKVPRTAPEFPPVRGGKRQRAAV